MPTGERDALMYESKADSVKWWKSMLDSPISLVERVHCYAFYLCASLLTFDGDVSFEEFTKEIVKSTKKERDPFLDEFHLVLLVIFGHVLETQVCERSHESKTQIAELISNFIHCRILSGHLSWQNMHAMLTIARICSRQHPNIIT